MRRQNLSGSFFTNLKVLYPYKQPLRLTDSAVNALYTLIRGGRKCKECQLFSSVLFHFFLWNLQVWKSYKINIKEKESVVFCPMLFLHSYGAVLGALPPDLCQFSKHRNVQSNFWHYTKKLRSQWDSRVHFGSWFLE